MRIPDRPWKLVILFVAALVAIGSGTALAGARSTVATNDTLVVALPGLPTSIDLERSTGGLVWHVANQVYARGMEYRRGPYPYKPVAVADPTKIPGYTYPVMDLAKATPGIIRSCSISKNGKSATYQLRQGVRSAAGNEFTSADVLYSVRRSAALKGVAHFFHGIASASKPSQWKAAGKYTVRITGAEAMPMICSINVHLYWLYLDSREVKKHATASDPWATQWLATNSAAFGAYQVTSWDSGKQIVLEANENYWRGAPTIKRIIWQVVPDAAGRQQLLQAGKVQIADSLSVEQITSLAGKPNVRVAGEPAATELFIVMNNKKAPFNDVKVRQAINTAIPRSDIVTKIFHGLAADWQGPSPGNYPAAGYVKRTAYNFNLEKAKQLLEQGGAADGFSTSLSYSSGDPIQEQVAILLQRTLGQIGVKVTLQKLPPTTIQGIVTGNKADFALWVDSAFLPEASFVSQVLLYPGLGNFANYDNPAVFKAVDGGKPILNPKKRIAYFKKVQSRIYADAPYGWITQPYVLSAVTDKLVGYGLDVFPFFDAWRLSLRS